MRYIVPSIGRCGSSVMAHQLHLASGAEGWQYRQNWTLHNDTVMKTHAAFTGEPAFDYRAVFCWGNIGDIVASMWLGMDGHLMAHLAHLGVMPQHRQTFAALLRADQTDAWLYLVQGDKLHLKHNFRSWHKAQHVLFVHYDDWLADPASIFRRVSEVTGLQVESRPLHARRGHFGHLPDALQAALRYEYGSLV